MARRPDPGDSWAGMSTGMAITATMLAGPAVWGAIGYLVDRLAGSGKVFTAIGMIVGAIGAGYIVYLRYGRERRSPGGGSSRSESNPGVGGRDADEDR